MAESSAPTYEQEAARGGKERQPSESVSFRGFQATDRIELLSTLLLAIAAVLTAWSAFQSAKWSGVMSIRFNEAGAARTESTRFDTLAGQQTQVDVALFTSWLAALNDDRDRGKITLEPGQGVEPTPGTLSGFLFERLREEFRPAMDAWLATGPVRNPDAPSSPFAMDEYRLAAAEESDGLQQLADDKRDEALVANQTSDDYVFTAILFASVLFFAGISTKMQHRAPRRTMVGVATLLVLIGAVVLTTLPIELGEIFGTRK